MNIELQTDVIICGDNCEVMRTMPSESIDLVVTSPPYDDLRTYGGHSWDFYGVAWNLKRLLKPGGVIVWVVGDATVDGSETGTSMRQALHFQQLGLRIHDTMIYEKHSFRFPDETRYYQTWEYMFVMSRGKPKTYSPIEDRVVKYAGQKVHGTSIDENGNRYSVNDVERVMKAMGARHNVWRYANGKGVTTEDSYAFNHPAMFPESLARDHILSWSNEGDIVLDPFSGSGTTAKMAKHNGRKYIGIEVNPDYIEISKQRLAQGVLF
jgi:site-specific DNA-methyltransferase (adenine-specific)